MTSRSSAAGLGSAAAPRWRSARFTAVLGALFCLGACAPRQLASDAAWLFTVEDAAGDDSGAGELTYPLRPELGPGSLDLLRFSARPESDGTLFEVELARSISQPDSRAFDAEGKPLSSVARLGFYTFNLELYLDQDRVDGSGNTALLPGRNAELASDFAWEKAVFVTPRPVEARSMLKQAWSELGMTSALERQVHFPERVHVSGRTLRFYVPNTFLSAAASRDWGYVLFVTAADLTYRVSLPSALRLGSAAQGDPVRLMLLPVGSYASRDQLGGAKPGLPPPPPILDLLAVDPGTQRASLTPASPEQPAKLRGVVPSALSASNGAP